MKTVSEVISEAQEEGRDLGAKVQDPAGLYWLGVQWLEIARNLFDAETTEVYDGGSAEPVTVPGEMSAAQREVCTIATGIAQSCFTGAQTAIALADWSAANVNRAPFSDSAKAAQQILRYGDVDVPHPALAENPGPVHPAYADEQQR